MTAGFIERGVVPISRKFTKLPGGVIKPRPDHHISNHEEPKPKKSRLKTEEVPLIGVYEHLDSLGFPDPSEDIDPDVIDRITNSGSAIVRGIEPGRVYNLFDPENEGEPIELSLPEAGFHIVGPGYLHSLSRSIEEMQRIDLE